MKYDRRTAKIARYIPIVAASTAPISIQVALTDACFNRCIGCGHPQRQQKTMRAEEWLGFLSSLSGVESVCYSGGDPMAYRQFNVVMSWHIEHSLPFGATITGYVPPYIDTMLLSRAAWVRVSLDAVDEALYERVRGKTPLFKVFDGIDKMLAAGVHVGLGITLHPENEAHYPEVLRWAEGRGITDIDARYAYPASNPAWPDASLDARGVMPFNRCAAALYQMYIDSDGSAYPCCVTAGDTRSAAQGAALGNVLTESWASVWAAARSYSQVTRDKLPEICRTSCVQRLSEINYIAEQAPAGQSFF